MRDGDVDWEGFNIEQSEWIEALEDIKDQYGDLPLKELLRSLQSRAEGREGVDRELG